MAPEHQAIPVFPHYDLPGQYALIEQVAARSAVPLPALRWNQPDGGPLGTAFFVMDQVEGRVPLDNPPYVFGGWLAEATDPAAPPGRAARLLPVGADRRRPAYPDHRAGPGLA
ncbi:MAG: hypothetical protein ACR2FU_01935 [Streptosporangiaceae bacterium]